MSQPDPAVPGQHQQGPLADAEMQFDQGMRAYNSLVERITPWLFDIGSWIFGGLIAFTLLILPALITTRPADLPIEIATAAFAVALPLNVTGLVLLRIVGDVKPGGFEQETARMLQEAGFTPGDEEIPSLTTLETMRKRGTRNVLNVTVSILTVGSILTLVGLGAALWHMAWWIAAAFGVMVFVCLVIVQIVMLTAQPRLSPEEKAQLRQHRNERIKRAKEQKRQAKQRR